MKHVSLFSPEHSPPFQSSPRPLEPLSKTTPLNWLKECSAPAEDRAARLAAARDLQNFNGKGHHVYPVGFPNIRASPRTVCGEKETRVYSARFLYVGAAPELLEAPAFDLRNPRVFSILEKSSLVTQSFKFRPRFKHDRVRFQHTLEKGKVSEKFFPKTLSIRDKSPQDPSSQSPRPFEGLQRTKA